MAEFTYKDLKTARESRKIKRWELANELGVSEDTIYRWESGSQRPDPDDIGNIERVLNMPGLWHKWMLSQYDSYREKYTKVPEVGHLTAEVVRMKHEVLDIIPLFDAIERDTLDGKIDDPKLWEAFRKECREAVASIQQLLDKIPKFNPHDL